MPRWTRCRCKARIRRTSDDRRRETASAVHVRPERRCRRTALRDRRSCRRSPAARIAVRSRLRDLETLLEFYDIGRARGDFDAGIQSALERMLVSFNFLFRVESNPPERGAGHGASAQRSRSRVAAVVLSLEQHSRRRAADPGRARTAARPRRPRAAGAAHAARSAFAGARGQLRHAVARPAQGGHLSARPEHLS